MADAIVSSKSFASLRFQLIHGKIDPWEESLDHPAMRQDLEADLVAVLRDHFDGDAGTIPNAPGGIGAVDGRKLDEGDDFGDALSSGTAPSRSWTSTGWVWNHQRAPIGVDHVVALSPLDHPADVMNSGTASLDRLDTLAVDHRRRR